MSDVMEVRVPQENVNDESVAIVAWHVAEGDAVRQGQPLAEVETSKATFDIPSPAAGVVKIRAAKGTEARIGEALCYIGPTLEAITAYLKPGVGKAAVETPVATTATASETRSIVEPSPAPGLVESVASPAPRRISQKAAELLRARGLNESDIPGDGLLRENDILVFLGEAPAESNGAAAPPCAIEKPATAPKKSFVPMVPVRSVPISRIKRVEARFLGEGMRGTLRSAVSVAVSTRGLGELKRTDLFVGELLSAAVIFESARLLRKYPAFNAYCADDTIHYYEEVNVGYALDMGSGLRVPVVRGADAKSLPAIVDERRQTIADLLGNELRPEVLSGGTFTITDLSGDGVFHFDPLITQGQSAILGVGGEFIPPGGNVGMFNLILAFDHQITEGRTAAQFLGELKERLEAYEASLVAATKPAAEEPYCYKCFTPFSGLVDAHLVSVVSDASGATKLICTVCLEGW
jgi:pyruvate/2-oxoglutarate dehydrogenase complex dihydrolipoamide acyltransferase (E2) component